MQEILGLSIDYSPRNLMRINSQILDSSRFSPDEIRTLVSLAGRNIQARIDYLHNKNTFDAKRRRDTPPSTRPVILIARIALLGEESSVIIPQALQSRQKRFVDSLALTSTAKNYWNRIDETAFRPEIHTRGIRSTPGTSGIWLAVNDIPK